MKFIKKNLFQILIIIVVALLSWYKILFRFPTGEGYFYFNPTNTFNLKTLTIPMLIANYGVLAKLTFTILIPIFKDNIPYYMYFQFLVMLATYLTFYYVLFKIFNDKILATVSTIFFISNYVGQFTMMGQGDYQRFIQRVPNVIPTLIAFMLLFLYLRNKKTKYFTLSFFIYILSLFLSHYTTFFLPLFIFLPMLYWLFEKKISFKKALLIPFIFVVTTLALTRTDTLRPTHSIIDFATHTTRLTEMVAYQIPMTGFPIQFTKFFATHSKTPVTNPYTQLLFPILIIVCIYLYLGFLQIKENKENLAIYFTLILTLLSVAFLMMYAYETQPNPLVNFGEDRIYFVHSIIFAIIWGMIIKAFVGLRNKKKYLTTIVIIVGVFLLQNIPVIWQEMDSIKIHSQIARAYFKEMKYLSPNFNQKSVIVETSELITVNAFIKRFYHLDNYNFISFDDGWETKVKNKNTDKNNVFVLQLKPNSSEIINLTSDFRSGKKL